MLKTERQAIALLVGSIIALIGVLMIHNALTTQWTLEVAPTKIATLIGGGFITLIDTVIFLSGVSEDAVESVTDFLGYLWDRFLEALGR